MFLAAKICGLIDLTTLRGFSVQFDCPDWLSGNACRVYRERSFFAVDQESIPASESENVNDSIDSSCFTGRQTIGSSCFVVMVS